ncbi:N-acetylmuramoyl-L-alanine amidase [Lachnospiraceae bacterium ZAX-1]
MIAIKRMIAISLVACLLSSNISLDVQAANRTKEEGSWKINGEDIAEANFIDNDTMEKGKPVAQEAPADQEETKEEGAPADQGETKEEGVPADQEETKAEGVPADQEETKEEGAVTDQEETKDADFDENEPQPIDNTIDSNAPAKPDASGQGDVSDHNDSTQDTVQRQGERKIAVGGLPDTVPNLTVVEKDELAKEGESLLNFIGTEYDYIETPGVQNVIASIGDKNTIIENAVLQYKNTANQKTYRISADKIIEDAVLFTMQYKDSSLSGIYELECISYRIAGVETVLQLKELDMKVQYGVNQKITTQPDAYALDEEIGKEDLLSNVEANIVAFDGNGKTTSKTSSIPEVLLEAQKQAGWSVPSTKGGNIVIVLDPGHDSTHGGCSYQGYKEQDLTLKIAKYCKAELSGYRGVEVYMTRETAACPFGGDNSNCLKKRVEYAKKKGATALVSLHLNANNSSSAHGWGIYCPNNHYNADIGTKGQELAKKIAEKLAQLGIAVGEGIKLYPSQSGDTYPDGSLADYYAIVRQSKLAGFPGIIVEHAFLSNAGDVANFLNSDAKLKKLGVADAKGIADYYGLTKGGTAITIPTIGSVASVSKGRLQVKWKAVNDAVAYYVYRSTAQNTGYSKIATLTAETKYTDTDIQVGTVYYYKVKSVDSSKEASGYSNVKSGQAVANPTITYVKANSNIQLEIAWGRVENANGYRIQRSTQKNTGFATITDIANGEICKYVDGSVESGTTYYYKVLAKNQIDGTKGVSSYSKVADGWAPAKASAIKAVSKTYNSLEVSWKKIKNAYRYVVYRSDSKKGKYAKIQTLKGADATKYVDKKLKAGQTYYYKVIVQNRVQGKVGSSGYSGYKSGKTIKRTSVTSVVSKSESELTVKWKSVKDAVGYQIQRSTKPNSKFKKIADIDSADTTSYVDAKDIQAGVPYYYRVQVLNKVNKKQGVSGYSKAVSGIAVAKTSLKAITFTEEGYIKLSWKKTTGASGYQIQRKISKNGKYAKLAIRKASQTSYIDKDIKQGETYYYRIQTINEIDGIKGYSGYSSAKTQELGYAIMGNSTISVDRMAAYYNTKYTYPTAIYKSRGADSIQKFCQILEEEAKKEGVKAEVVFAQMIHETGGLQFGGIVKAEQCNFAGLGALGSGEKPNGEEFLDVRTGLRAQVQHLKAYASTEPLKQAIVDTRFQYVVPRGSAPYVEWLGQKENPSGLGWATTEKYGYKILTIIDAL